MIVETKGKTLEETAVLFDGADVAQAVDNGVSDVRHDERDYDEKASGSITPPSHEKV